MGIDWRSIGCMYSNKWLRFDKKGFRVIVRHPNVSTEIVGYSDMVERFAIPLQLGFLEPQVYVDAEDKDQSGYIDRKYVTALCKVGF